MSALTLAADRYACIGYSIVNSIGINTCLLLNLCFYADYCCTGTNLAYDFWCDIMVLRLRPNFACASAAVVATAAATTTAVVISAARSADICFCFLLLIRSLVIYLIHRLFIARTIVRVARIKIACFWTACHQSG